MAEVTVSLGCILTGPERVPCDAVFIIECGHDDDMDGLGVVVIPAVVVLGCTLDPGHDGDLHHDIDGLWWRADG